MARVRNASTNLRKECGMWASVDGSSQTGNRSKDGVSDRDTLPSIDSLSTIWTTIRPLPLAIEALQPNTRGRDSIELYRLRSITRHKCEAKPEDPGSTGSCGMPAEMYMSMMVNVYQTACTFPGFVTLSGGVHGGEMRRILTLISLLNILQNAACTFKMVKCAS